MIGNRSVLVIVPARGGSKGIPRKNLLDLRGRPLVSWPIQAALSSKYVDRIICSTDDEEIAKVAISCGAEVPFLRPKELAIDETSTADVLLHVLDRLEAEGETYDYLVLLEPTSPLTTAEDVNAGIELLDSNHELFDSLVTVTQSISGHPDFTFNLESDGLSLTSITGPGWKLRRRQEISKLFFVEGTFYMSKISTFRDYSLFIQERTIGLEVPRWKSFEIDDPLDVIIIEAIIDNLEKIKTEE